MARNTNAVVAQHAVTLTPEALQQVIAQAIAEHEAAKAQKAKADTSTEMERLTIKAFRRAGYDETRILPRQNVLTYAKWVEKGFKVKEGQRAVVVKSLRLFHADQVEKINKEEQAEYLVKRQERIAAKTSDKLPPVSPIAPVTPAKPVKGKPKSAPIQAQA